jgi:hypothetical protein
VISTAIKKGLDIAGKSENPGRLAGILNTREPNPNA